MANRNTEGRMKLCETQRSVWKAEKLQGIGQSCLTFDHCDKTRQGICRKYVYFMNRWLLTGLEAAKKFVYGSTLFNEVNSLVASGMA